MELAQDDYSRWHDCIIEQRWHRKRTAPIGEKEKNMTPTIVVSAPFVACDRCGVRAKVKAHFLSGELYFCLHHTNQFDVIERAYEIEYLASGE